MSEEAYLGKRPEWLRRYDRRRLVVLCLELVAITCWIVYGVSAFDRFDLVLFAVYAAMYLLLFLPGILYIAYDVLKTRQMSVFERYNLMSAEPEDDEFTKVILRACLFLLVFYLIVIVPAFLLLNPFDAYLWTLFMTGIITLTIATLLGAQWKLNTSYSL